MSEQQDKKKKKNNVPLYELSMEPQTWHNLTAAQLAAKLKQLTDLGLVYFDLHRKREETIKP